MKVDYFMRNVLKIRYSLVNYNYVKIDSKIQQLKNI